MRKIILRTVFIAIVSILFVYPVQSQMVKASQGCSDCNYCRMKIEGIDLAKIKELTKKAKSEVKATEHGMLTIISLSDEPDVEMFQDYHKKRSEKMQQLDNDENTKACKCCGCYDRANARISGKLNDEVLLFENGIIQLVTSQDNEEVKKLHHRVELINKASKEI